MKPKDEGTGAVSAQTWEVRQAPGSERLHSYHQGTGLELVLHSLGGPSMVLITVVTPAQTNSTKVQNKPVEPVEPCVKVSSELLKPPKLKKKMWFPASSIILTALRAKLKTGVLKLEPSGTITPLAVDHRKDRIFPNAQRSISKRCSSSTLASTGPVSSAMIDGPATRRLR